MTDLKKPVRRKTHKYVVMLCPAIRDESPILKIKELRRRHWFEVSFEAVYALAARKEAERRLAEKRAKKIARKVRRGRL